MNAHVPAGRPCCCLPGHALIRGLLRGCVNSRAHKRAGVRVQVHVGAHWCGCGSTGTQMRASARAKRATAFEPAGAGAN
eukprot:5139792-Alexandrium_andersonii.AAC.1